MAFRRKALSCLAACCVPVLFIAGPACADYTFQTLTYGGQDVSVLGIGNRGQTVGQWMNGSFIWDSTFTPVAAPSGYDGATFTGINDSDTVVGQTSQYDSSTFQSTPFGFTYSNGQYAISDPYITYNGINKAGDLVGWSTSPDTGFVTGWASWINGNLYYVSDGNDVQLTGVNAKRQFVGFYVGIDKHIHGLFKDPAAADHTVLDAPQQVSGTQPEAINDNGDIAGMYSDAAGLPHGFVRTANGTWIPLDYPGSKYTAIYGINNGGTVCGSYTNYDSTSHSFIATPSVVLYGFSDVVTALEISSGLLSAQGYCCPGRLDVNNDGRITLGDAVRIARKAAGLDPNP